MRYLAHFHHAAWNYLSGGVCKSLKCIVCRKRPFKERQSPPYSMYVNVLCDLVNNYSRFEIYTHITSVARNLLV